MIGETMRFPQSIVMVVPTGRAVRYSETINICVDRFREQRMIALVPNNGNVSFGAKVTKKLS